MGTSYKSRLPDIASDAGKEAAATVARTAARTSVGASTRVPVRTGKTRSTIRVTGRAPYRRRVKVNFPGRLLEYGTRNMRARPFLVAAAEDARRQLLRDAAKWFR